MKKTIITSVLALCLVLTGCISVTTTPSKESDVSSDTGSIACDAIPMYQLSKEELYFNFTGNPFYQNIISNDIEADLIKCCEDIDEGKSRIIRINDVKKPIVYLPISNAINSVLDKENKAELVSSINGDLNLYKSDDNKYFSTDYCYCDNKQTSDLNSYESKFDGNKKYRYKDFYVDFSSENENYNEVYIVFKSPKIKDKYLYICFSDGPKYIWGGYNGNKNKKEVYCFPQFLKNEKSLNAFLDNLENVIKNDMIEYLEEKDFEVRKEDTGSKA